MLQALGSAEPVSDIHLCCDVCDSSSIPAELNIEDSPSSSVQRRTRRAIRVVDEDLMKKLKENLEAEREAYIFDHPSFRMLGPNFVCPNSVIDKICLDAKFITCIEDLNTVIVAAEVKSRFLRVVLYH